MDEFLRHFLKQLMEFHDDCVIRHPLRTVKVHLVSQHLPPSEPPFGFPYLYLRPQMPPRAPDVSRSESPLGKHSHALMTQVDKQGIPFPPKEVSWFPGNLPPVGWI